MPRYLPFQKTNSSACIPLRGSFNPGPLRLTVLIRWLVQNTKVTNQTAPIWGGELVSPTYLDFPWFVSLTRAEISFTLDLYRVQLNNFFFLVLWCCNGVIYIRKCIFMFQKGKDAPKCWYMLWLQMSINVHNLKHTKVNHVHLNLGLKLKSCLSDVDSSKFNIKNDGS